jgi:hypothetical protein
MRLAQDTLGSVLRGPILRPADPSSGIVWADSDAVWIVRRALVQRGSRPAETLPSCGASLQEFALVDPSDAEGIGLKLSPLGAASARTSALVLGAGAIVTTPGAFVSCAFPDDRYLRDFRNAWCNRISPPKMQALIDSLLTVPELVEGRVDPSDSLTLSLTRVVDGTQRSYETTLDSSACWQLCRITRNLFRDERDRLGQSLSLGSWWGSIDARFGTLWNQPRPKAAAPRVMASHPPADALRATIVGWLVDDVSGTPIPHASIRLFDPPLVTLTDEEGAFAFRDQPPKLRYLQINAEYHQMVLAFFDFHKGAVDTVVVRIEPEGTPPTPPSYAPIAHQANWHPMPNPHPVRGERLAVLVRNDRGMPIPRAYVVIARGRTRFGALASGTGDLLFPAVPAGRGELLVRADGYEPFSRTLDFANAGSDSMAIRLDLAKR